ncbi:MAG TPA: AMIN domain-containing protein [Candidatus Sulfotelmatobacter sp.]|nr:AMIN domain-containing protein [Candidatus Sulfotelmatobacter sp.]
MELPKWPKDASPANTVHNAANQSNLTKAGISFQLLATVYAVIALVITLRSYSSTQKNPEFIWLFIACSASFYIVLYNALSVEQAIKLWLYKHYPAVRGFSIVIAVMLAAFPFGALYILGDVAENSASTLLKTPIPAASSASLDRNGDGVNVGGDRQGASNLARPILVVSDVQYQSGLDATTVTIGVDESVQYEINRLTNPDRIYLDFRGSKLDGSLLRQRFQVTDPLLRAIRIAEHKGNVSRVTLETNRLCDYLLTTVAKSHKLQIELLNPAAGQSTSPLTFPAQRLAAGSDPSPTNLAGSK